MYQTDDSVVQLLGGYSFEANQMIDMDTTVVHLQISSHAPAKTTNGRFTPTAVHCAKVHLTFGLNSNIGKRMD